MTLYYVVFPAMIAVIAIAIVWFSVRRMARLGTKPLSGARKITERVILTGISLAAIAVACTSVWNAFAVHAVRPPGQQYVVDGHRMRIDCTGSGSPAIILDAGLGNDGLIWGGVQPALAKTTRVCSYDRAGFGWSDARPAPRDADHIATELHGLLTAAGVHAPVVLMGHSISGIYIRDYATRYPADVAGLIFVDGSTPLQNRHPAFRGAFAGHSMDWARRLQTQLLFVAGVPRLFGQCSQPFPGFDPTAAKLQGEDLCRRGSAADGEMANFDRSGEETAHSGPYGALPILIFSQDPGRDHSPVAQAWNQMQENLKKLSTRSRRIIARGSTHYIQIDRADLIKREVPLFIEQIRGEQIRGTAPQPSNDGSTTTE